MNPLGKRLFITLEPVKEEIPTTGVTYSTAPVIKKPTIGIIEKRGGLVDKKFNVGDRVFIGEYYPDPQDVDGELVIIIDEDKIIAL
jgi:co-chaperonin GroES (HSP10)